MDETARRLKIGITGASGFLGSHVAETVVRAGHLAVGFSRNPARAIPGCTEMRDYSPPKLEMEGLDAVVHLAGESIFGLWTRGKKERIMASRRDGTRAVVDSMLAAAATGGHAPRVLVCASGVGFYGNGGEQELDESAPPGGDFLAEVCQAWEKEAFRAWEGGIRVVTLRFGIILSREGGALKMMRPFFLAGLGAQLGDGRQWVSWIHVRDAANLALFCVENPDASGPLNATSPHPLRNADFTQAIARRWNRKAYLALPAPLLKLALRDAAGIFLASQRAVPAQATKLGFVFHSPKI